MLTFRVLLAVLCALVVAPIASAGPWEHSQLGDDDPVFGILGGDDPSMLAAPAPPKSVGSQAGCRTSFLDHNFSSRAGAMPRLLVLHYTVSRNVEGWDDVNAIRRLFNRDSFNASSNYIIDREGHCKYIVNEAAKAWTQTFYNPWSISIEFIATGRESADWWRKGKGLRVGAKVFADAAQRWDIPIRFVNPSAACDVPPMGITDHESLDCQNTHTDVEPHFPVGHFMNLVKAEMEPEFRFQLRNQNGAVLLRSGLTDRAGQAERLKSFLAWAGRNDEARTRLLRLMRDGHAPRIRLVEVP